MAATTERVLVQVKLRQDIVKAIDLISVEWDLFRNQTLERLVEEALTPYREQPFAMWSLTGPEGESQPLDD